MKNIKEKYLNYKFIYSLLKKNINENIDIKFQKEIESFLDENLEIIKQILKKEITIKQILERNDQNFNVQDIKTKLKQKFGINIEDLLDYDKLDYKNIDIENLIKNDITEKKINKIKEIIQKKIYNKEKIGGNFFSSSITKQSFILILIIFLLYSLDTKNIYNKNFIYLYFSVYIGILFLLKFSRHMFNDTPNI